jgi:hypothetical protein
MAKPLHMGKIMPAAMAFSAAVCTVLKVVFQRFFYRKCAPFYTLSTTIIFF